MKIHHAKAHGESLAGFECTCANCGEEVIKRSQKYEKAFCDEDCMAEWQAGNWGGEENPAFADGRVEIECENCGETFERWEARRERSRFCSTGCLYEWRSESMEGEDHPRYDRVELACETCATAFTAPQHKKESARFCSWECKIEGESGEGHPHWHPDGCERFGSNWKEVRERVVQRDEICQICGSDGSDYDKDLHVHHIVPRRLFQEVESANTMDNLVLLCAECHSAVEFGNLTAPTPGSWSPGESPKGLTRDDVDVAEILERGPAGVTAD